MVRARSLAPGLIVPVIFLMTLAAGAGLLSRVVPSLRTQPEYQFQLEKMRFTKPHAWVPETILKEVLSGSHLSETVSLLDPDLCRTVAEAWARHPWVKRVISVHINSDPALIVDVEYRQPAALIRVAEGFYPVDTEGVLLPPRDFTAKATELLPQVWNVVSAPRGGAGEKWEDPTVPAAARLATILAPGQDLTLYWNRFQLKAILVPTLSEQPGSPDQLMFELETAGGNRVLWGRPPGEDSLEPTPEVKLARLKEYQARFGSLDGISGRHRIDIRMFDGTSLHPLGVIR